jgi:hypothetical protein
LVNVAKKKGVQVIVYSSGAEMLNFSAFFEVKFKRLFVLNGVQGKPSLLNCWICWTNHRFFIPEKSYWTGNRLFNIPISKVSRVEVDIPQNPELAYTIGISENKFELERKYSKEIISNLDNDKISTLLVVWVIYLF